MSKIKVDFSNKTGKIKPMHCVNNGPLKEGDDIRTGNFDKWIEMGIPYSRNHDASLCIEYGGDHTVDVWAIFPDFDADVNDPASYDFVLTDRYTKNTLDAGTKIFYRLGTRIEHWVKKYGTLPPRDYKKWAEICEHIIMHYNEGWADGYHWNIEYWEIWNEADLNEEDAPNKRTWGGTKEEFFDFYEVASKYLKNRFPHLKIGGPALSGRLDWGEDFIKEMGKRQVPMDFFSWHRYCPEPDWLISKHNKFKKMLIDNGYGDIETICNEWNYIRQWTPDFLNNVKQIISIKGAAFAAACMIAAQHSSIDMMMYYDARPSRFNGLFDFYTLEPLKTFYTFKMFNELYKLENSVNVNSDDETVYVAAAENSEDEAVMICCYTDDDNAQAKTVDIEILNGKEEYDLYLLDEKTDCELVGKYKPNTPIEIGVNTVLLLK